ncbi:MAG: HesA/MoeB/ThiF family protein [Saprospiraceae bacterium]|nr:HesA/MoeB/ThiF family protein [Saprospiraceae bacterium]
MTADRFDRQRALPGFGAEGQFRLAAAKILVVGAGGLGCPALRYLAAAGVGRLGIVDGDVVAPSNLHRQVLFGVPDIGFSKAERAATALQRDYPDGLHIDVYPHYLTSEQALDTIRPYDAVLDGSDNFATRYMVNDACVLLNKPLALGAVYQHEGHVTLLNAPDGRGERGVNYRDLYPKPPGQGTIPNCHETGVLGILPGVIGTLQAAELIKLLSGYGETLSGKLLYYNALNNRFWTLALPAAGVKHRDIPVSEEAFRKTDYAMQCGASPQITWKEAMEILSNRQATTCAVDLREMHEYPDDVLMDSLRISLEDIDRDTHRFKDAEVVLIFCQNGYRSQVATILLGRVFPGKSIYSIEGGTGHPDAPTQFSQS